MPAVSGRQLARMLLSGHGNRCVTSENAGITFSGTCREINYLPMVVGVAPARGTGGLASAAAATKLRGASRSLAIITPSLSTGEPERQYERGPDVCRGRAIREAKLECRGRRVPAHHPFRG